MSEYDRDSFGDAIDGPCLEALVRLIKICEGPGTLEVMQPGDKFLTTDIHHLKSGAVEYDTRIVTTIFDKINVNFLSDELPDYFRDIIVNAIITLE